MAALLRVVLELRQPRLVGFFCRHFFARRHWLDRNRLGSRVVCGSLHFLHERMRRRLDMAHCFAELASQLGELFGAEQQQREQENNGGVGRAEHTLRVYFRRAVRVIFFPAPKFSHS